MSEITTVTAFVKYGPTGKRTTPLPVQITCESSKRKIWENATLKEVTLDNYFIDNIGPGQPVKNLKGNKGISFSKFITESKGNKPLDGNPLNVTICNWLPVTDKTQQIHRNVTSHILDAMRNIGLKVKIVDTNVIYNVSAEPHPEVGVRDNPFALETVTTIDTVPVTFTVNIASNIITVASNSQSRSFEASHCLTSTCAAAIHAVKQMVLNTKLMGCNIRDTHTYTSNIT